MGCDYILVSSSHIKDLDNHSPVAVGVYSANGVTRKRLVGSSYNPPGSRCCESDDDEELC